VLSRLSWRGQRSESNKSVESRLLNLLQIGVQGDVGVKSSSKRDDMMVQFSGYADMESAVTRTCMRILLDDTRIMVVERLLNAIIFCSLVSTRDNDARSGAHSSDPDLHLL
jgi:hypothetical protein